MAAASATRGVVARGVAWRAVSVRARRLTLENACHTRMTAMPSSLPAVARCCVVSMNAVSNARNSWRPRDLLASSFRWFRLRWRALGVAVGVGVGAASGVGASPTAAPAYRSLPLMQPSWLRSPTRHMWRPANGSVASAWRRCGGGIVAAHALSISAKWSWLIMENSSTITNHSAARLSCRASAGSVPTGSAVFFTSILKNEVVLCPLNAGVRRCSTARHV